MRLSVPLALASLATTAVFACAFDPSQGIGGGSGSGGQFRPNDGTGNAIVRDAGACVKDPGSDTCMEVCNAEKHQPAQLPPDLLIVLDKSGSMNEGPDNSMDCQPPCQTKWVQVTAAINNVVNSTQANVNWGLKFFANDNTCGVNDGVTVDMKANNAGPINDAIAMQMPAGNTPTRAAMTTATTYMRGVKDANPKYILLATDGQPNCALVRGQVSRNTTDDAAAIQSVADALAAGFPTFVVGISTARVAAQTLSSMATAGGVPRAGGGPTYYEVTSTQDLEDALKTITGQIATCNYPLAPASPTNDPNAITVHVNGKTVAQDQSNGWDYTNGAHTAIRFFGSSCDQITKDPKVTVEIFYACMGQPPVP